MPTLSGDERKALDDAGIKGGSPIDRVIGMLLERTEAVRELHASMRTEYQQVVTSNGDVRLLLERLSERLANHEKTDMLSFEALRSSLAEVSAQMIALRTSIDAATTASVIQKAQVNAGWKVISVIGAIAIAGISLFAIFFNHKY